MHYIHMRFPGGLAKAVTCSYDDGVKQDMRLAETLTAHGLKGTFNYNSYAMRGETMLTKEEVETYILSKGHEVALHGSFHRAPGMCRPAEGIRDILECRLELEGLFGRIIRGMAYPDSGVRLLANGVSYEQVKSYLTELDVAYARTLGADNNDFLMPNDWHRWMPTVHHNNPNLMEWLEQFLSPDLISGSVARHFPRLFYFWGHSYEFDRDNNWHVVERLCERLDGHPDVWFATNMEIYEYTMAYRSLVWSADSMRVYNPTLKDLWFVVDGKPYMIRSGETICL